MESAVSIGRSIVNNPNKSITLRLILASYYPKELKGEKLRNDINTVFCSVPWCYFELGNVLNLVKLEVN